jgi:hypothetical protein
VAEHITGALLFLVPVALATIVAYLVTRPRRQGRPAPAEPEHTDLDTLLGPERRRQPAIAHPTLLHAALSSHLTAVTRTSSDPSVNAARMASRSALLSAGQASQDTARLVSIRRPARIPRRPSHRCPHQP